MFKHKATYKYMLAIASVMLAAMVILVTGVAPNSIEAASHREAPLISQDPGADITDFFMFRSYESGKDDKVVLIMDVIPGEEPSSGPNYWNFDPGVRYEFHIDNDADGKADDVEFYIQFETKLRGTIADAGLGLRQEYNVTMARDGNNRRIAEDLLAVPSNVGPRTMPDYEGLAAQGIYDLDNGIRIFAGQRDDPFYIDLGAAFDTLNLRNPGTD
ncbi:MAG TPA: DUF4331 family protein, partial [Anaerolineae bacterium]|nr:DUF4331 family protein [Anaerolineae bacterium]